ncbi:ThiF family adenylyltransferase [Botrimarina sp.]|uniref:ThiF family adenylyltransferase n=1 Tax=Botrimarina sp. TaxID=2795802 RepID=UPI0032EB8DB3
MVVDDTSPGVGQSTPQPPRNESGEGIASVRWDYDLAFARNRGLISREHQEVLRNTRVAIAGLGGVGGNHLIELVRMGFGRFTIADPDTFDVANTNRQFGAKLSNQGRGKAEAMAEAALDINPELDLRVMAEPIGPDNLDRFFDGADLYIDGLDFWAFSVRPLVFREARRRSIWAITSAPLGFSAARLVFDPGGMSFDEYFGRLDEMPELDRFCNFLLGLAPAGTHFRYLDLSEVDRGETRGPSSGAACSLCAAHTAVDAMRIICDRKKPAAAPAWKQFDAYFEQVKHGVLRWGNRGPVQRAKLHLLKQKMRSLGYA